MDVTRAADTGSGPTVVANQPEGAFTAPTATVDHTRDVAWSGHPINIRLSIPLGFARYYLTFVAGRERRSPTRRISERGKHPLETRRNLAAIFLASCVIGLALYGLQLTLGLWTLERFLVVS